MPYVPDLVQPNYQSWHVHGAKMPAQICWVQVLSRLSISVVLPASGSATIWHRRCAVKPEAIVVTVVAWVDRCEKVR